MTFILLPTFLGTTLIVFWAEKPPDWAKTVKIPDVSATNLPLLSIKAEAGRPMP